MEIFQTERLIIREIKRVDQPTFVRLMANPKVMDLIPQAVMDEKTSLSLFNKFLEKPKNDYPKVWAVELKSENCFVGLAAYLKNEAAEDEIGYRLIERVWGAGLGTELARGLLNYGFETLQLDLITADVWVENKASVKILEKFFIADKEFFNEGDQSMDRRYKLWKKDWKTKTS